MFQKIEKRTEYTYYFISVNSAKNFCTRLPPTRNQASSLHFKANRLADGGLQKHIGLEMYKIRINSRLSVSAGYYSAPNFYKSKNLNCIGALSFLRLEEEYWRSPFFNQLEWFLKREMKRVKNEWIWCWTKVKSGAKREWFLFIPLFLREREIDVWKNFL